jgi:aspartokinase
VTCLQVDGVYNCDPLKNPGAVRHSVLSYEEVHQQRLQVMDQTAITLCEENHIPVVVYNLYSDGHLVRVLQGDAAIGTTVSDNASPVRVHLLLALALVLRLSFPQILRALPCRFPGLIKLWH